MRCWCLGDESVVDDERGDGDRHHGYQLRERGAPANQSLPNFSPTTRLVSALTGLPACLGLGVPHRHLPGGVGVGVGGGHFTVWYLTRLNFRWYGIFFQSRTCATIDSTLAVADSKWLEIRGIEIPSCKPEIATLFPPSSQEVPAWACGAGGGASSRGGGAWCDAGLLASPGPGSRGRSGAFNTRDPEMKTVAPPPPGPLGRHRPLPPSSQASPSRGVPSWPSDACSKKKEEESSMASSGRVVGAEETTLERDLRVEPGSGATLGMGFMACSGVLWCGVGPLEMDADLLPRGMQRVAPFCTGNYLRDTLRKSERAGAIKPPGAKKSVRKRHSKVQSGVVKCRKDRCRKYISHWLFEGPGAEGI